MFKNRVRTINVESGGLSEIYMQHHKMLCNMFKCIYPISPVPWWQNAAVCANLCPFLRCWKELESAGAGFFHLRWHLLVPLFPVLSDPDQSHYQCSCKRMGQRAGRRVALKMTAVPLDRGLIKACCCFHSIMELLIIIWTSHSTRSTNNEVRLQKSASVDDILGTRQHALYIVITRLQIQKW